MSRTAIMYLTERCNQACVFCLEDDGAPVRPDVAAGEVRAQLASLRARGAEHITFMGGETLFRKDLPELLGAARAMGFTRLGVTTNGTALAHPGFLGRMIDAGLDFVEISVHADDAALAARISGRGFTWERQQRALEELAAARDRILPIVNIVICRENADRIAPVIRALLDGHPRLRPVVKLKLVSLVGAADEEAAPLRLAEIDLAPALALLRERGVEYWLYNIPLCRIPGEAARSHEAQALVLDWRYHDYDHRRRDGYYDSAFQLEGNVWPVERCGGCRSAPICPGLEESYRARVGDDELRAQHDDPIPAVAAILRAAGCDPARAGEVLAGLATRSRPSRFVAEVVPRAGEAALRFAHPRWDEPLWFELAPVDPARRAPSFASGKRFRLSYRKASRSPGEDPDGRALLDALVAALAETDADPAIEPAAERLGAIRIGDWSCAAIRMGPRPADRTNGPLAIRMPSHPRDRLTD